MLWYFTVLTLLDLYFLEVYALTVGVEAVLSKKKKIKLKHPVLWHLLQGLLFC